MDHFLNIYRQQAAAYHVLIAAEDADGNLPHALATIASLAGKRAVDLGSGTGRLPLLLAGLDCEIVAVDLHRAMLLEQSKNRMHAGGAWGLLQADLRRVPIQDAWADLVTAGWAIGHFVEWYGRSWKTEAARAIDEMLRLAAPGSTLVVMETLGTGVERPKPPNEGLAAYYRWLEQERGFSPQVISTDYQFESVKQAVELCAFFFGAELAAWVRSHGQTRLPEWTGLWSKVAAV